MEMELGLLCSHHKGGPHGTDAMGEEPCCLQWEFMHCCCIGAIMHGRAHEGDMKENGFGVLVLNAES